MTKSEILNALDNEILGEGKVTKVRHTNTHDLFVDELYSTIITDTQLTTQVLEKFAPESYTYTAYISKIGNNVNINIKLLNTSSELISGDLINIINSDYFLNDTYEDSLFFSSSNGVVALGSTNKIRFYEPIPIGGNVYVNINYKTND